jgi:hypothetical protein
MSLPGPESSGQSARDGLEPSRTLPEPTDGDRLPPPRNEEEAKRRQRERRDDAVDKVVDVLDDLTILLP